jgi:hypothetical protein
MKVKLFNKPKAKETSEEDSDTGVESVYLSVSEAAIKMEVYENTIRSWFDTGWLDGYKTPSGHRKIERASVVRRQREREKGNRR